MMPTRLGNVLRRHEDLAGAPYGLPGIEVVPAVSLVASPDRTGYMSEGVSSSMSQSASAP